MENLNKFRKALRPGIHSVEHFSGIIGWLSCIVMLFVELFGKLEVPGSFNLFLLLCAALLGLDTVVDIIKVIKEVRLHKNDYATIS